MRLRSSSVRNCSVFFRGLAKYQSAQLPRSPFLDNFRVADNSDTLSHLLGRSANFLPRCTLTSKERGQRTISRTPHPKPSVAADASLGMETSITRRDFLEAYKAYLRRKMPVRKLIGLIEPGYLARIDDR